MLLLPSFKSRAARLILVRLRCRSASNLCQIASYSQLPLKQEHQTGRVEDIRNIGIIAHVDAGKTTTTERMLFYSGVTARAGDVDAGNTVTDFLDLERQRGITIQSAAITFRWPRMDKCAPGMHPKTVNLIDTPGHQDFCFEVDRCLPILDGAVCIIDSVKGVEAHTERVWGSAERIGIPGIFYCNKLDREGASFRKAVSEIATRLKCFPLVCQIPWWNKDQFVGVIDIIDSVGYHCTDKKTIRYEKDELMKQLASSNADVIQEMEKAREELIMKLTEFDDALMEELGENLSSSTIKEAIRKCVVRRKGWVVPVFAGSSLCHIGVEPLMDAVVNYLPSPADRLEAKIACVGNEKCTLDMALQRKAKTAEINTISSISSVFKVFDHPKEGLICFVRIYRGTLCRNASTFNTNLGEVESPMGILQISADKTHSVEELSVGQIGALRGLKRARTGDTLITMASKKQPGTALRSLQILSTDIPPSVAFLQVEPYGKVAARELELALQNASRQDPSLQWQHNQLTDQYTVQGMGKLHLEVSLHAMRQKHKIDAHFGPVEVDYRECILEPSDCEKIVFKHPVAGKSGKVTCLVKLEPISDEEDFESTRDSCVEREGNWYCISHKNLDANDVHSATPTSMGDLDDAHQQLLNGAIAGMARGPRRAAPLYGCLVTVTLLTGPGTYETPTGGHFSEAARIGVQSALRDLLKRQKVGVVEPVMRVKITCPEQTAGTVQHDISSRAGGHVLEVRDRSIEAMGGSDEAGEIGGKPGGLAGGGVDGEERRFRPEDVYAPPDPYDSVTSLREKRSMARMVEIVARVPYKEMLDYDEHMRSKTSGRHTLTMDFDSWARVVGHRETNL